MRNLVLLTSICVLLALFSSCSQSFYKLNRVNAENQKTGYWIEVSNSNHFEIIRYKNSLRHGKYILFSQAPNSSPDSKGRFKEGKKHQKWVRYYDDRRVESITRYKNGKRHGISKMFNPDGILGLKAKYQKGENVRIKTFNIPF